MRHKYATQGLVLGRTPIAEAGVLVTVLTPDLGLIRARAEGVRRSGAKLAHALQTWCAADLMLVRGKEGWRVTGAVLSDNRFAALPLPARRRAARVAGLLVRLVQGEAADPETHALFEEYITALHTLPVEDGEAAESLSVLRLLAALGFDSGALPPSGYGSDALRYATEHRNLLISRINRGIAAAGA